MSALYCCDCGEIVTGSDCETYGCFAGSECTIEELKAQLSADDRALVELVGRSVSEYQKTLGADKSSAYAHGFVMAILQLKGADVGAGLLSCMEHEVSRVRGAV